MDYEKKYKKALERAKEELGSGSFDRGTIEYIFPELAESEDEGIRKEFCKDIWTFIPNEKAHKYIGWLEKQGTPAKLSEEEQNRFAKGVLSSCASSFINYLDAHKYEGKMCVSNGECEDIENAFHNAMWDRLYRYYCKYIEKSGEQETPCDKCKKAQPSHSCSDITALGRCYLEHEKQDEQKPFDYENANIQQKDFAPMVEPKFKVGDRVNKNDREDEEHCILTITSVNIDEHCYICDQCSIIDFGEQDLWHIVEQKPAWSEEDEKIFRSLLNILTRISLTTRTDTTSVNYSFYTEIEWLKSLKDRYTWKPSDEQMRALHDMNLTGNISYAGQGQTLIELYNDLKKLREE